LSRFIVLLSLYRLCANLAHGLQELNKTYLLKHLLTIATVSLSNVHDFYKAFEMLTLTSMLIVTVIRISHC